MEDDAPEKPEAHPSIPAEMPGVELASDVLAVEESGAAIETGGGTRHRKSGRR